MSDIDKLIAITCLDRAYAVAKNESCFQCGMPATRYTSPMSSTSACDDHSWGQEHEPYDFAVAPAVRRLVALYNANIERT